MIIYANGCSMTYGSELHDHPVTGICTNNKYRWESSWPGALARRFCADSVVNDAVPSGSNDRILRRTVEFLLRHQQRQLSADSELVVAIGWSSPLRREMFINGAFRQIVPHHGYRDFATDRFAAAYRRWAVSDIEGDWRFVGQAVSLAGLLQSLGIPFVFFHALDPRPLPISVQGDVQVRTRQLGLFDGSLSMEQYLADDPSMWRGRHPSEEGHAKWADELVGRWSERANFPGEALSTRNQHDARIQFSGTEVSARVDMKIPTGWARSALRSVTGRRSMQWLNRDPFIYP
ncbi:DUF6071 family protein [Antrihabitans cavernicola]|uniref:DUF6071 family protein n=1 Tax=Antrihabitans cavernicola TaxID=2495913 RepID=UPI00338E261E